MSLALVKRTINWSLRSPVVRSSVRNYLYKPSCSPKPPVLQFNRVTPFSTGKICFAADEGTPKSVENKLPPTDLEDILDTPIARFRKKIGLYAVTRNTLRLSAAYLYVACTDKVPVELFFKELNLPDTFYSWFLITEVHCWMMMTRLMAEGSEGRFGRNELVKCLWEDCDERLRMFHFRGKALRNMLGSFNDQFRAAILAYDEGFTTGDKQLLGALWRTLYSFECEDDPRPAERMIQYIRTQMDHLHTSDRRIFLVNGDTFEWAHFEPYHVS